MLSINSSIKCKQADANYAPVLTHFLDPRGQYILEVITRSYQDLHVTFLVDHMQKNVQSSHHYILSHSLRTFELTLFELQYPKKFVTIQHQHVLGTLMSLGIQRDQLGDIIVGEDIQFVLTKQLESYIISELTRIKGSLS